MNTEYLPIPPWSPQVAEGDDGFQLFPNDVSLNHAAQLIRSGRLVAFPTETVYGLGTNVHDASAVARIFEVKARPHFNPLIVHVAQTEMARRLVASWPPMAQKLADEFWPGPLTIVLPKQLEIERPMGQATKDCGQPEAIDLIPDIVTAGLNTVGVRVPAHPVARRLIELAGVPIAAPSANHFGSVSPTCAEHVRSDLGNQVDLVVDGGPCKSGLESTVVALSGSVKSAVVILRLGATPLEAIERVVDRIEVASSNEPVLAPGMLPRHYAPRTRLRVVDRITDPLVKMAGPLRIGVLSLSRPTTTEAFECIEVLSQQGDLLEAAANFFAAVRRLDKAGLDLILAERLPDHGLGRAINDRLRRASLPVQHC